MHAGSSPAAPARTGRSAPWRDAIAGGASEREALEAVVDMLVEETMHGID